MLILLLVAFLSGLMTIFAPCIWPILPIVLSSSSLGGKRRPFGVTLGILISFTILTLSLSYLVRIFGFDPNILRLLAVVVLIFLGLVLIIPKLSAILEGYATRLNNIFGNKIPHGSGFWGGFIAGISLGIVWAPCAGPILATIAALSATRSVNSQVILVTLVYMIGTGIPLFLFATFGSNLLTKSRVLSPITGRLQQIFGAIMILTAVLIWTGYDRIIQADLLDLFPSYTNLFYKLEQTNQVQQQLQIIKGKNASVSGTPAGSFLPDMGKAPEIVGIVNWLNSPPLTIAQLKGKVVLVDFWTYSCINCIRTLPFVTGWYEKYKDKGFVVIGVHTPEFEFEKNTQNVMNAIQMFHINYPVAQDNNYATWNNFNNFYWPAKYLIDKDGHLRFVHDGEGMYTETEKAIQSLLAEAGSPMQEGTLNLSDQTPEIVLTPETYLGLNRLARFGSDQRPQIGDNNFSINKDLPNDYFGYDGQWTVTGEYGESQNNSGLELNFNANKVFLVITPNGKDDVVKVLLDGNPVSAGNAGADVSNGQVKIDTSRLYELINLHGNSGRHLLRLEFDTQGTRVFAFTFG